MGPALRRYDAHKHLITNSFATDRIWDEMNRFPWMDFVQHHTYLSSWDTDSADTVLNALRWVDDYGKPYLLGEFGGAPAGVYGAETNIVHDADPRGIHIHNSLWAASLSGAAGTPLNWWWDEYVRPKNLYHHYAALSRFLEGTPWLDAELKPEDLSTTHVRIRVLRGSTWARVWAQNREFTWPNAENLQGISRTESVPIWIEHLQPGTYGIQWWDTLQGVPLRSETKSCDGTLNLIVPPLQQDIAVRINLTAKE